MPWLYHNNNDKNNNSNNNNNYNNNNYNDNNNKDMDNNNNIRLSSSLGRRKRQVYAHKVTEYPKSGLKILIFQESPLLSTFQSFPV